MNFDLGDIVERALREDLPSTDVTTDALKIEDDYGRAKLVAKEDLVLSGTQLFEETFRKVNPDIQVTWNIQEASLALKGQTLALLKGPRAAMLKAERVALNFLGQLSGIATLTRCYVNEVSSTSTKILDTRKTTPGLRAFQKAAVKHGGGTNHRMNLSDEILVKENHILLSGGIESCLSTIKKNTNLPISVEVKNLEEVQIAVRMEVKRILLDNMSNQEMAEALKLIPSQIETEASGNMTLERVKSVAETGVSYISVGAITHSAPCADISLLLDI